MHPVTSEDRFHCTRKLYSQPFVVFYLVSCSEVKNAEPVKNAEIVEDERPVKEEPMNDVELSLEVSGCFPTLGLLRRLRSRCQKQRVAASEYSGRSKSTRSSGFRRHKSKCRCLSRLRKYFRRRKRKNGASSAAWWSASKLNQWCHFHLSSLLDSQHIQPALNFNHVYCLTSFEEYSNPDLGVNRYSWAYQLNATTHFQQF